MWTPISDHLEEDGRWWHTPYFGGAPSTVRHDGFRILSKAEAKKWSRNRRLKKSSAVIPIPEAEFTIIPAGTFTMGTPGIEPGRRDDETQHKVTISTPFYMQTTPVTQGQWQKVMGNTPSHFIRDANCPVEEVSWNDVQEFIGRLNDMDGTRKYRLPTEAEWEYACRAGTTTRFSSGDEELKEAGWYNYNSGSGTQPVGQRDPNAWGLYDMHGNVWEWIQDWWGAFSSDAVTDPTGPSEGLYRVVRGGSWLDSAFHCRSAERSDHYPGNRYSYVGFRLIKAV
jgi:formylglycine-generating enzyme required for sulfatase activity